ncbi:hypothetical protein QYE76_022950 [Lolium multiflorum]|uniref:Retrotransposon gag domain-containing protein n=1 Tax=Lolium multiflorum TaxID=4521 RepID=A0AAD8VUL4_LOLMU|nr:hypothetical protein QYE76_022950 [Lolium multiflorum]
MSRVSLQDSINPKPQWRALSRSTLVARLGNLLADLSSADPTMSSTASSTPSSSSPILGSPIRFGSYEVTPHSDSSRSTFSGLQGNMEMAFGSVHYNVNAEGILRLLEPRAPRSARKPLLSVAGPIMSSSIDLSAGLTDSTDPSAPSTPRSTPSMSVGSDNPVPSEMTSYYCLNCDTRQGLGSSDTPFICSAQYSSGEDSVDIIVKEGTWKTTCLQVYAANNTGNARNGGEGEHTPRSSRRRSFGNSASNHGSDYTIAEEEWAAARAAVLNNTPLPVGASVGTLNAFREILDKNRERLSLEKNTLEKRLPMQCLQLYLKDSARAWLRGLPKGSIKSWDDLVDAFVANFQATYKRPVGIEELRHCQQKPKESMRAFIGRFTKLLNAAEDVSVDRAIDAFSDGIRRESYIEELGRKKPKTITKLMEIANSWADGEDTYEDRGSSDDEDDDQPKNDSGGRRDRLKKRKDRSYDDNNLKIAAKFGLRQEAVDLPSKSSARNDREDERVRRIKKKLADLVTGVTAAKKSAADGTAVTDGNKSLAITAQNSSEIGEASKTAGAVDKLEDKENPPLV